MTHMFTVYCNNSSERHTIYIDYDCLHTSLISTNTFSTLDKLKSYFETILFEAGYYNIILLTIDYHLF